MTMALNVKELMLIENYLMALQMYEPYKSTMGHKHWEPYMRDLLTKVRTEIHDQAGSSS